MSILTEPRTEAEKVADQRIIQGGIPFLEQRYPFWRPDARHAPFNISDPQKCMLCYLEGAARAFGPFVERDYMSIQWLTIKLVPFHEVLKMHGKSLDDAIACGFARATTDPNTFYATLNSRWRPHFSMQRELAV